MGEVSTAWTESMVTREEGELEATEVLSGFAAPVEAAGGRGVSATRAHGDRGSRAIARRESVVLMNG